MSKVENPAVISLGLCGLYVKATSFMLPLNGSDTNWYKNMLVNPMSKLSLNGTEILSANGRPITDKNRVADVVRKFNSRYGEGEVKKYYTKFDAAVEVPL